MCLEMVSRMSCSTIFPEIKERLTGLLFSGFFLLYSWNRHDICFPPVFEHFSSCHDQRLSRVGLQWPLPASSALMGAIWGKKALSTSAFSISCATRSSTSFSREPTFSVGYLLSATHLKELFLFFSIPDQIQYQLGFGFPNFSMFNVSASSQVGAFLCNAAFFCKRMVQ